MQAFEQSQGMFSFKIGNSQLLGTSVGQQTIPTLILLSQNTTAKWFYDDEHL